MVDYHNYLDLRCQKIFCRNIQCIVNFILYIQIIQKYAKKGRVVIVVK